MGQTNDWKILKRRAAFENAHVRVDEEEVQTPTRGSVRWTTVHRKTAVAVAPITAAGKFVLIREERPPVRQALWTFPAGQVDGDDGEAPEVLEATVWRELAEETGYGPVGEASSCVSLGRFYPSPGFCSECLHLFLARPVARVADPDLDELEAILETREVTAAELLHWVHAGEIADGPSLALVARLHARPGSPELPPT